MQPTQYVLIDFQGIDETKLDNGTLRGIVNELYLILGEYGLYSTVATARVVRDQVDSNGKTTPKLKLMWKGSLINEQVTAVGAAVAGYLTLYRQDVVPLGTPYTLEQEHSP